MKDVLLEISKPDGNFEYKHVDIDDLCYSLARNKKLKKIVKKIFNEYLDLVDTDTIYEVTITMLNTMIKMYREQDAFNTKLDQQILKTAIQSLNSLRLDL